jgi:hypothetical protein
MTSNFSIGIDPANGEGLEFLVRFAEALARSLANEDNERELTDSAGLKDGE